MAESNQEPHRRSRDTILTKRLQRVFSSHRKPTEFERVLQTVSKYVSHDRVTAGLQKQREAFVQKHQELEKSRKDLEGEEYNFRVQTTMLALELTAHSKSACLELATEFYATVSREVRDLVYSYLYGSIDETEYRGDQDKTEPMPDHFRQSSPHWQSKEYVGYDFAREYTEFFYEHTQLQFKSHWCSTKALDDLLLRDPFGYGITPVDLIRTVYITFHSLHTQVVGENIFENFKDQSKVLLKLKQRAHVTFRIQLDISFLGETLELVFLISTLKSLIPIIYDFKKHGRSFDVFIVFESQVPTNLARNVQFLWSMAQEDLMTKIESWSTSLDLALFPTHSLMFGPMLRDLPLEQKSDYSLLKWMLNAPDKEELGQDYLGEV